MGARPTSQQTRHVSGGRGRLIWGPRWLITVSEFGLRVALGLPGTERIKDGQANSEHGDADEDLSTAMCCFGASLAGGSKNQDQSERKQGVIAPVCLVLPEREQERRPGK